jgi:hypothetical protein
LNSHDAVILPNKEFVNSSEEEMIKEQVRQVGEIQQTVHCNTDIETGSDPSWKVILHMTAIVEMLKFRQYGYLYRRNSDESHKGNTAHDLLAPFDPSTQSSLKD